jgi:hypothetical protein
VKNSGMSECNVSDNKTIYYNLLGTHGYLIDKKNTNATYYTIWYLLDRFCSRPNIKWKIQPLEFIIVLVVEWYSGIVL